MFKNLKADTRKEESHIPVCEDIITGESVGLGWTEVFVSDVGCDEGVVTTFAGGDNRDTEHTHPDCDAELFQILETEKRRTHQMWVQGLS